MEYVFGTKGEIEVLKVKCDYITGLSGYQQVIQRFRGETITDNFRVVRKLSSKTDTAGNIYDWYEIDRHYRTIDRTAPLKEENDRNAANIDYLSMMIDVELPGGENDAQQEI